MRRQSRVPRDPVAVQREQSEPSLVRVVERGKAHILAARFPPRIPPLELEPPNGAVDPQADQRVRRQRVGARCGCELQGKQEREHFENLQNQTAGWP